MCIALCVLNPQKISFRVRPPPKNKSNSQLKEQKIPFRPSCPCRPFARLANKKGNAAALPQKDYDYSLIPEQRKYTNKANTYLAILQQTKKA
jgi:hypothetical protein